MIRTSTGGSLAVAFHLEDRLDPDAPWFVAALPEIPLAGDLITITMSGASYSYRVLARHHHLVMPDDRNTPAQMRHSVVLAPLPEIS